MSKWEPSHTEVLLERIAVALERTAEQTDSILEHWEAQHKREEMLMVWRKKDRAAALARAKRDDEFVAEQRAAMAMQTEGLKAMWAAQGLDL